MKKVRVLIVLMAVTALVLASAAYAADAPAKDAKAAAAPAKPAAAPAAPAPKIPPLKLGKKGPQGVKCDVTGKVASATIKNKKGEEKKVCQILVAEAKGPDGKPMPALAGKPLNVVGPKAPEVEKLMGKVVQATGEVVNNKRIKVDAVKEAAPAAPAAEKK